MKNNNTYNQNGDGFSIITDIFENEYAQKPITTPPSKKSELFEWLDVIVTALISVIIIFGLFFRVATIDGDSMLDTLHEKDRVIISNFAYEPQVGDIVVISRNIENTAETASIHQGPIIKRVIATENQLVDINFETSTVYVDGVALEEDYIYTPTTRKDEVDFPLIVPEGCIFVLGDNRAVSLDSRSSQIGDNGMIDTRYVLGKAVFRIFPLNKIGRLDNK